MFDISSWIFELLHDNVHVYPHTHTHILQLAIELMVIFRAIFDTVLSYVVYSCHIGWHISFIEFLFHRFILRIPFFLEIYVSTKPHIRHSIRFRLSKNYSEFIELLNLNQFCDWIVQQIWQIWHAYESFHFTLKQFRVSCNLNVKSKNIFHRKKQTMHLILKFSLPKIGIKFSFYCIPFYIHEKHSCRNLWFHLHFQILQRDRGKKIRMLVYKMTIKILKF